MVHGWWRLDIGGSALNDADREHIAKCIEEGYTQGEICHEENVEGCRNCEEES